MNLSAGKASHMIMSQVDLATEYLQVLGLSHECIVSRNKDPNDKSVNF